MSSFPFSRRTLLQSGVAAFASPALAPAQGGKQTEFQIACMTLPYSPFPLDRALKGIKGAGYNYVAWGTTHQEAGGERRPVIAPDAPAAAGKEMGARSRDHGLEPVMMFAGADPGSPDAAKVLTRRIEQAAAARMPFVLAFGHTRTSPYDNWIRNLKEVGPIARANGVTVVIKQHGGVSATGRQCAEILHRVSEEGVQMCYDAGNNLWYVHDDPVADIRHCWQFVRAFAIKDLRLTPRRDPAGPGLGEIDHYRLLLPVARTGLRIPLCCETLWAPLLPRPKDAEGVDFLARRAREFLELCTQGILA
jgi:sugar phosphate isomerase/epimerase